MPPRPLRRRRRPATIARHLDWAEFHEHLLARGVRALRQGARRRRRLGDADDAQLPARPGGDAAQRRARGERRRSRRPRLLPRGRAPRAATIIARRTSELAVRCDGHRRAGVRVRDRRRLPAFLPAARRARQRLHRARRARLRPPRLQHLHGRRARSLDRRAHRSTRPRPALRGVLAAAHPARSRRRASTRSTERRRCASSRRGASDASPA